MIFPSALDEILSQECIKSIHQQMFSNEWKWAGLLRTKNMNMGVDYLKIGNELNRLIQDCKICVVNNLYDKDEIAVRFKHRLVVIHPFTNGNGRLSRMMADILIGKCFKLPVFSWGGSNLNEYGLPREKYLAALRKADAGSYKDLVAFARS